MKKILLATIVPALIVLFGCGGSSGSNDAITLKFNLPKGSGYDYDMDMTMAVKGNMNGQSMDVTNKMGMGYHFGVVDDSSGWKKISSTISKISMKLNAGGMNIDFDSDKPSADTSDVINGTMGKVFGAMKGAQFSFIMNDQGKIGYVSGINEMVQRITSSLNVPGAGSMAAGMGSAFNEDNFKQNIQQAFGVYPSKPVKPGDSWTSEMKLNNSGVAMNMNNTYTLASVNGNTADVKVNSKISSDNSGVATNGVMTGDLKYDIPTGVPVDGDIDMNMDMNVNSGGHSIPMKTDIKMKITGKKS